MMSSPSKRLLTLTSSDKESFDVEEAVASESVTIKHMIEDLTGPDNSVITLPNVTGSVLAKVIEYCKKHAQAPSDATEVKEFDAEFVKADTDAIFDLILAANYLNIPGLLDITCQAIADIIKDLQPEEVRKIFNIKNDYTKEEEEELRKQNEWAFQDI